MKYSVVATFLLAAVVIPAWSDNSHEAIYDEENPPIANQITDNHQSYDRKGYYQQNDIQHYPAQQEHSQPNYHQYKAQAHPQLKEEGTALATPVYRHKEAEDEHEDEEKVDRSAAYTHQMRQNNFVPHFNRPNVMMNAGQNFRQGPQYAPPKFSMEQQMQMQMQLQRQRMLAAAQAQAFLQHQQQLHQQHLQQLQHQQQQQHQHQQHISQPPAQHFQQPPAQHYQQPAAQQYQQPAAQQYQQSAVQQYQPPAAVTPQVSPQVENYQVSRPAAVKPRYQPTPPPGAPKARYAPPQQAYYEDYETPRPKE